MKQRKRGIRRMFAGAMAALMMLSVVDVSGWGVMNAKAEETAEITLAENAPQYLYVGDGTTIAVIWDGKLQDDEKIIRIQYIREMVGIMTVKRISWYCKVCLLLI